MTENLLLDSVDIFTNSTRFEFQNREEFDDHTEINYKIYLDELIIKATFEHSMKIADLGKGAEIKIIPAHIKVCYNK